MTKKLLMVILCVAFLIGISLLIIASNLKKNPVSTVGQESKPTAIIVLSPTPISEDPFVTQGRSIKEDIKNISDDLSKIKKEDNRLVPPTFLFDF